MHSKKTNLTKKVKKQKVYQVFCYNKCNKITPQREVHKPEGGGYLLCNICQPENC